MASVFNPLLSMIVLALLTASGCFVEEKQIYEDPRTASPKKLRSDHDDGTLSSFGAEVISSSSCLYDSRYLNAEIKVTQLYGLDSCSFEEESILTILTTESELEELRTAVDFEEQVFISFTDYSGSAVEDLGCESTKAINMISFVDDYLPLNERDFLLILRGDNDVRCSGSQ